MSIIAINPEVLEQANHTERRLENPSLKLTEDMRAAATDGSIETWEDLAANMQKIGYFKVWPIAFELLGKHCPKEMVDLKQKVVAGAVAECLEKLVDKHYFEGDRLKRTMDRIGAIYLLARKVDREGFVQFSFGKVLAGHDIPVPDYLNLEFKSTAPKNTGDHHHAGNERPRRSTLEMFKCAPAAKPLKENRLGELIPVKKHKAIVPLTPEQKALRAQIVAKKKEARAAKAAQQASKKKDEKKQQGKQKRK